ncbi:MAG: U32 family peptidase C-terminal domain-containing protein [Clostridia bacterium]|nr:U32 family peptidase C-terminal domain-containing protein [Clostridia bacterium]
MGYEQDTGRVIVEQRNRFFKGDTIEVLTPGSDDFAFEVDKMYNENDELIDVAPHAQMTVKIDMGKKMEPYTILRKCVACQG